MIYSLRERKPETLGEDFYVAPTAAVIGSVRLGRWSSVWFGAVLRGDNDWIELGDGTNVQDGTVMHTDAGTPLILGRNVTVGHGAMLHKCRVGDNCLIGNKAMILDGAVVGSHTIVAAGALVPPRKLIPSGVLVMGSPAKVMRDLTDEDRAMIEHGAEHYVLNAQRYKRDLLEI
jgi:carbonic anhydrase/acetyltransferase-like protein (isoleucine patch superfamily)